MINTQEAIDAFVSSYCLSRSRVYPYKDFRQGDLIICRDDPPQKSRGRNPEIVVYPGADPRSVARQINDLNLTSSFTFSPFCDSQANIKEFAAQYRELGYRLRSTEGLFVFDLRSHIPPKLDFDIRQVITNSDEDCLYKLTKSKIITSEISQTLGGEVRTFYCSIDGNAVGWCRSVVTHPSIGYVGGMYTAPEHRRKGIGRSLLSVMLSADKAAGLEYSVLLATHTGALLYEAVGYERIGTLVMMSPKRG